MAPTPSLRLTDLGIPPPRRHGLARRGLNVVGLGAVIAAVLTVIFNTGWWRTLVYSEFISLACWFFIDVGRLLCARWVHRHHAGATTAADGTPLRPDWPGWHWMLPCILLGTVGGVIVGSMAAQALLGHGPRGPGTTPREGVSLLLISLIPGVMATYFFWSKGRLQAMQARAEAAQRQAAEHQLRLLESQLEPHMLFNTLANLRVLIGLDPARAQTMLDRLIAFLRATLSASRVSRHPLSQEFARVADYLALMKIRMGERLRDELLLPPDLAERMVPPLLLQPLVENAIKHGLEPHVAGGRLQVCAALEDGHLVLRVRDTGAGLSARPTRVPESGAGFGLTQVRERLATLYGGAASLELAAVPDTDPEGGTLATVRLPDPGRSA